MVDDVLCVAHHGHENEEKIIHGDQKIQKQTKMSGRNCNSPRDWVRHSFRQTYTTYQKEQKYSRSTDGFDY